MGDEIGDVFEDIEDRYDPRDSMPEEGTPETALILALDCDTYEVLAFTGRYFHSQIEVAGFKREEIGVLLDKDINPGLYVFENGWVRESRHWETGMVEDVWISGDVRPARIEDFDIFGVYPMDTGEKDEGNGRCGESPQNRTEK